MNTKIKFQHFHDGNDPWTVHPQTGKKSRVRGSHVYATRATLVDLDTGNELEEAWAFCSSRDVPSRQKGREVALGRLQKRLGTLKRKKSKTSSSDPTRLEQIDRMLADSLQAGVIIPPPSSVAHLL